MFQLLNQSVRRGLYLVLILPDHDGNVAPRLIDHDMLFLAADHRVPFSLQGMARESGADAETSGCVIVNLGALVFVRVTKHESLTIVDGADQEPLGSGLSL